MELLSPPSSSQGPTWLQVFWGAFRDGNWGSTWGASSCTDVVVEGFYLPWQELVPCNDGHLNQWKHSTDGSPSSCRALFHSSLDAFMKQCLSFYEIIVSTQLMFWLLRSTGQSATTSTALGFTPRFFWIFVCLGVWRGEPWILLHLGWVSTQVRQMPGRALHYSGKTAQTGKFSAVLQGVVNFQQYYTV